MGEQPTGTVTLLFTDIEGSTRLLERLGAERYRDALDVHRRLLREVFERHSGYEIDYQGDSFFVTFASAAEAVAAASEGQRALARAEWPEEGEIRVRMGLHTGEPLAAPPKYVGLDVHKAARIMSVGHGGQVLISATTQRLVSDRELVSLGEHRLKDLLQPEPLYQVAVEGLPSEFPALRTLGNRPTNLPVQPNLLIGREHELAGVTALLCEQEVRLLTLTGPGGTGKTRLALQAAAELLDEFASGVFFVSLAPIHDPGLVVQEIARALALREVPGEELPDTLAVFLEQKRMLLVLDNFEQVVEAAVDVGRLLERCPHLRVLVTSRERLRLGGERLFVVPPLALVDPAADPDVVLANEAVALFVARATAASDFTPDAGSAAVIAEICARLDGLPLAIELAAARTVTLTPQALLRRLAERLPLLTGGARDTVGRQQTLRAAIDWSYQLLNPTERALFAGLSVFADGCRQPAAEAVCATDSERGGGLLDLLQALVDKSLLRVRSDPDQESRYWMLETIREFAAERLRASDGQDAIAARHADYVLRRVSDAFATQESFAEVITALDPEQANVRAALTWMAEHEQFATIASAVSDLWRLWRRSPGQLDEGLRWIDLALAHPDVLDAASLVLLLHAASEASRFAGDSTKAHALKQECLATVERTGAHPRLSDGAPVTAHVLGELADMALAEADRQQSRDYLQASLAAGGGPTTLSRLGVLALADGDLDTARRYAEQSLAGFAEAGNTYNYAVAVAHLGTIAEASGNRESSVARFREAIELFFSLGDENAVGGSLEDFARLAAAHGDTDAAAVLYGAARRYAPDLPTELSLPDGRHVALSPTGLAAGAALPLDEAVHQAAALAERFTATDPKTRRPPV